MLLVTGNAQSPLSPLEIGLHALTAVRKARGGRGKRGGLSAYAARLGKDESYVRQLRKAARVVEETPELTPRFLNRAGHLCAVYRAHRSLWPALTPFILEKGWSLNETKVAAGKVAAVFGHSFEIGSPPWCGDFLDPLRVARELATNADFTPKKVADLTASADATVAMIAKFRDKGVDTGAHEGAWRAWLKDNAGGDSWSVLRLNQRREELRNLLESQLPRSGWYRGNWREHLGELKDASVAAVVTDPPYGMGYVSPAERHGPIANDESPEVAAAELSAFLEAVRPKLKPRTHAFVFCRWVILAAFEEVLTAAGFRVRARAVWVKDSHGTGDLGTLAPKHELILHATLGDAQLYERAADVFEYDKVGTQRHPTEKPQPLMQRLIEICTVRGDLVADPFGGVATTAAAAKAAGRACWSCELDEKYWRAGERRLDGSGG